MGDLKTERAQMHYSLRNVGGVSRADEQRRFGGKWASTSQVLGSVTQCGKGVHPNKDSNGTF